MTEPVLHSVAVSGALRDGAGRVLLIQRQDNGAWELPGGVVERGEALDAALEREFHEETGVQVRVLTLTGVYKNLARDIVTLVFSCERLAGRPVVTHEACAHAWADAAHIRARMVPAHAVRALDACRTAAVSVRHHDGVELLPGRGPDGPRALVEHPSVEFNS